MGAVCHSSLPLPARVCCETVTRARSLEPRHAGRRDHCHAAPRPHDGQPRRVFPFARPDPGLPPLGDPAVDRLRARVQGPASPGDDAAQSLHRAVLPRRGHGLGGWASSLFRVPPPRCRALCGTVGRDARLARTGAGPRDGRDAACPSGLARRGASSPFAPSLQGCRTELSYALQTQVPRKPISLTMGAFSPGARPGMGRRWSLRSDVMWRS